MVKDGGLATVGIDYAQLGKETADMVVDILHGKKAGDIPVKVYKKDLLQSSGIAVLKLGGGVVLCGLTYWLIPIPKIEQYIGVMFLLFCLPPAANIVALETHYQGTGISAKYIASGTIVSCIVIAIYALSLQLWYRI